MRGIESLLSFLSVVLIHEAGHLTAAALAGARVGWPGAVGGGLRMRVTGTEAMPYLRVIAVYAAGAAFNLASLLIPGMGERFRIYSIGAAVFNLLPLRGSDGEGILRGLLSALFDPLRAERACRAVASVTLCAFWCWAVIYNLRGRGDPAMLLAVIAVIIAKHE